MFPHLLAYPLFLFLRLALRNDFSVKQIALCCERFAHDIDLFAIFGCADHRRIISVAQYEAVKYVS